MEQFMRYDIFMGLIQVLPISHVHLIKEYGGSGVFHRSGDKIPHDDLGVLAPGISHAQYFRIKFHHFRSIPENQRSILLRSEEHTSELQSLMRISYAVFCLKKK